MLGAVPAAVEAADDYTADTSTTGTVVVGGSQTGEIESHGDVDWIRVTLVGGTRYVIDYDGSANGQGTLSDPYFRGVYDSNGNLISGTTDGNGGLGFNSRIDFTPGSSGTYFLGLGNSAPSLTGTYRVSVTEFDDYVVEVHIPGDDYEDDMTTTGSVSVGGSAVGNFQKAGGGPSESDWIRTTTESFWTYFDHDWFRVTFDAGKTYRVHIKGSWTDHGTLRDTRIAGIYDSNGNLIQGTVDDNSGIDKEARTIFTAPTTGMHYISATRGEFPFPAQHSGTYTVKVEEIGVDDYAASTSTTGSVTVDGSTTGTIERLGDLDWFAVTLEGYATYRFDLEGIGEDWPLLEGKLIQGIYDSNGNVFAGTYTPESRDDEVRAVFVPEQGWNLLRRRWRGGDVLRHGRIPAFRDEIHPRSFRLGSTLKGRVGVGSFVAGAIENAHDRDWFRVTLEAGTTYQINLEGSPTSQGTLQDPYLHGVRDSEGDLISDTTDDNSGVSHEQPCQFHAGFRRNLLHRGRDIVRSNGNLPAFRLAEDFGRRAANGVVPGERVHVGAAQGDGRPAAGGGVVQPPRGGDRGEHAVGDGNGRRGSKRTGARRGRRRERQDFLPNAGRQRGHRVRAAGRTRRATRAASARRAAGCWLSNSPSTTIPGPSVGEPALSVSDASANEADESIGFAVTLSAAATATVTVDYATADGTATAGADYTSTSGTLTFQTGDTQKTISVPIIDDLVEDDGETLTLTLSNASGATLADGEATGTIHNTEVTEPGPPTVSISGGSGKEGDDDGIDFIVTLDEAASGSVTVDYVTSDGSADAGDDYTAKSGTLSFSAGQTSKAISVAIEDDVENESDETFTVTLSNASGADLGTATATGTIRNRRVEPLTARFENMPSEHDGSEFTFELPLQREPRTALPTLAGPLVHTRRGGRHQGQAPEPAGDQQEPELDDHGQARRQRADQHHAARRSQLHRRQVDLHRRRPQAEPLDLGDGRRPGRHLRRRCPGAGSGRCGPRLRGHAEPEPDQRRHGGLRHLRRHGRSRSRLYGRQRHAHDQHRKHLGQH